MDSLYDAMVEQMNAPGFTVGDKYQAKYDELGKNTIKILPLHTLLGLISFLFDYLDKANQQY